MATDPISEALASYAQGNLDHAKQQYMEREHDKDFARQQTANLALLAAKQAGEKDIESMREEGAMARTQEQAKGYFDRLSESELNQRARDLQKAGVQQLPSESVKDFVARGTTAVLQSHGAALDAYDKQLSDIASAKATADRTEANRQNTLANNLAAQGVMKDLDLSMTPQEKASVISAMGGGLSFDRAIRLAASKQQIKPDRAQALLGAYSLQQNTLQPQIQSMRSADYLRTAEDLDRRASGITSRRNALLNTPFGAAAEAMRALRPMPTPTASANPATIAPADGQAIITGVPSPTPTQPATVPPGRFLPSALQNPDTMKLITSKNKGAFPLGATPDQVISGTMESYAKDWQQGAKRLSELGFPVDQSGNIGQITPQAWRDMSDQERERALVALTPSHDTVPNVPYYIPGQRRTYPLGPFERERRYQEATKILNGMADSDAALTTLRNAQSTFNIVGPSASAPRPVNPDAVFGPPAATAAPASQQLSPGQAADGIRGQSSPIQTPTPDQVDAILRGGNDYPNQ